MDAHEMHWGPGKTAPRLIADLLNHDPRRKEKNGRNILADPAPHFNKGLPFAPHPSACRHSLVRNDSQTRAPVSKDEQPNEETNYVVSAYCTLCRCHFSLSVDFWRKGSQVACCQFDKDNPLHHFQLTGSTSWKGNSKKHGPKSHEPLIEAHEFACSGQKCAAFLEIRISGPRLPKNLLEMINDRRKLGIRGRRVLERDPVRYEGQDVSTPLHAFWYLRSYLSDAKSATDPTQLKKIAKRNKKYVVTFDDECDEIFEHLGFVAVKEPALIPEEGMCGYWKLPVITDDNRAFIDDVLLELDMLIGQVPPAEQQAVNVRAVARAIPAMKDIQRSLGYFEYPTRSRTIDLSKEEHPYFQSLGAVDDFTDELLSWAYDRQCKCDPANKPYYFDCLEDIAKGRASSDLQMKVTMAVSIGEYGLKTLEEAYGLFGLSPDTNEGDDHVMGLYKSRIASAPKQKSEAMAALLVIAKHRNSEQIEALAKDTTITYEEALELLCVVDDTPAEFVAASAVALASDMDKSRVTQALRVIAKKRGNDLSLQRAAVSMESGITTEEAYNRLQIGASGPHVPDETILTYYQSLSSGAAAGSKASYAQALEQIAISRDSNFLLAKLNDPNADVPASMAEPIGLGNIGNTCYLNSLLQYLYTIKPFRDMVMDFQDYRMELTSENLEVKRVGGRKVEKNEIVTAQKFVEELRGLFENLKTAPDRSIKPTKQLAELTLVSPEKKAEYMARRKSTSSASGPPNIASSMDGPISGPQLPPRSTSSTPLQSVVEDIEMVDNPIGKVETPDDSSETTLVDLDPVSANGENEARSEGNSPSDNVNAMSDSDAVMTNGGIEPETCLSAPDKPPPIPPRNKPDLSISINGHSSLSNDGDGDLLSFGAQQDVTEVMGNITHRLQCAIKPTGFEDDLEQIDIIRDTIYGTNTTYIEKGSSTATKLEAWPYLMAYPGKEGVIRDIYEALDVTYDQQMIDVEKGKAPQYASISKLPPILQIQVQRSGYDNILKKPAKNSTHMPFFETIYMDRYIANEDPAAMQRRRETWKWKSDLRDLEARHEALKNTKEDINVPDALIAVKAYIEGLQEQKIEGIEIPPELPGALADRIAEIAAELEDISKQIDVLNASLKRQFTKMREHEYKLHAVFIHRGEAGGGHYWVYIYDSEHSIWREYNDEHVSEVKDKDRIFERTGGADGTPYYLVYVRTKQLKEMVDVVCREVPDIPVPAPELGERMDVAIHAIEDDEGSEVRHVEHVKPRHIRPKPVHETVNGWNQEQWGEIQSDCLDANGRSWS
ncbi:hypothetical protein B2J93_3766 [Marssonina coronariae]|uniref:ubiquitinyl hydrolase 1 n=1 Tax=Diplocarpon coronariae TaxID=2795749 RepID=A0A218YU68_9HELO|nr:hypothetical protein B2J93_3766 [Marssonina coronariae]